MEHERRHGFGTQTRIPPEVNLPEPTPNLPEPTRNKPEASAEGVTLLASDEFDLLEFFQSESEPTQTTLAEEALPTSRPSGPETDEPLSKSEPTAEFVPTSLLLTLRNEAHESITTLSSRVSETAFSAGSLLTSSVFQSLNAVIGSCGVFCMHGLQSVAQASSSTLSGLTGSGLSLPNLTIDRDGSFHLDGNIDMLSAATGLTPHQLMSGAYSSEDILRQFFGEFGSGLSMALGFGMIDSILGSVFDGFIGNQSQNG